MITSICTIGTSHSVRDVGPVQSEATQKKMLLKSGTGGLTMAEYIEREKTVERLRSLGNREYRKEKGTIQDAIKMISYPECTPAADVAPVVHGRWDDSGRYTFPGGSTAVRCTNCGCALTVSEYHLNNWNYCPVCGAKMDGGDNDAKSV